MLKDPYKIAIGDKIRWMREHDKEGLAEFLQSLSEEEARELEWDWGILGRPEQIIDWEAPENEQYSIFLALAGRGWGKTKTGSAFIYDCIVNHGMKELAIVGPAAKDVRNIMVNGPSGILAAFPPHGDIQGTYSMGKGQVIFTNGAKINLFSTEASPDSIRGGSYEAIWGDEIVAWADAMEFFDQSMFTLRLDPSKMLLTTTGKATPLILSLLKREGEDVKLIRGNTLDNSINLSKAFVGQLKARYEGTRLGKQEMGSEVLLENDTALWKMSTISANMVTEHDLPAFEQVVISIDPAMTHGSKKSDETGIVVCAKGADDLVYVMGDYTARMSPEQWSAKAIGLYDKFKEECRDVVLLVERNQGGTMLSDVLYRKRKDLKVESIFVTRSKYDRGVSPALLGEQNKIKFLKSANMEALQEELVTFDGTQRRSPNRYDSLNMGVHHLKPVKKNFTSTTELLI